MAIISEATVISNPFSCYAITLASKPDNDITKSTIVVGFLALPYNSLSNYSELIALGEYDYQ